MAINQRIRKLYQPIQPSVKQSEKRVTYQEFLPSAFLEDFIYCYWQLKTTEVLSDQFNYKVVSDGCIDIFFELNTPTDNFVMGFCKRYAEFPLSNQFNYIGIRFLPTIFPQIFNINAVELSNKSEPLDTFLPKVAQFIVNQLHHQLTMFEIKTRLDNYFTKLISKLNLYFDNRLYEALQIILQNNGVLTIEKDLNIGISPRQLQRLFNYYIGDTTKTFCKVVQFQNILKVKPSSQSLKQNKLFYNIGYYDQSHFIKDFKNFYGVTPNKAFRR